MKCINCGWSNNPDGATECEKCHSPLAPAPQVQPVIAQPARRSRQPETAPANEAANATPTLCSRCGYPMSPRMLSCPNCHTAASAQPAGPIESKTCPDCGAPVDLDDRFCRHCGAAVDAHSLAMRQAGCDLSIAAQFSLRPLPTRVETRAGTPIKYAGTPLVLNRANTEPANTTISADAQACIINESGRWYLENRSEALTTFLRVNRRTELRDGDIIVMGNRSFEFHI